MDILKCLTWCLAQDGCWAPVSFPLSSPPPFFLVASVGSWEFLLYRNSHEFAIIQLYFIKSFNFTDASISLEKIGADDICPTLLEGFYLIIKLTTRFCGLKKEQENAHDKATKVKSTYSSVEMFWWRYTQLVVQKALPGNVVGNRGGGTMAQEEFARLRRGWGRKDRFKDFHVRWHRGRKGVGYQGRNHGVGV